MSDKVITVRQEVQTILNLAVAEHEARAGQVADFAPEGVAGFHAEVIETLRSIAKGYADGTLFQAPDESLDWEVGDYVRLTGREWAVDIHTVAQGDIVRLDSRFEDGSFKFIVNAGTGDEDYWYAYPPGTSHFESWGGEKLVGYDPEIKVGDTVRILPLYLDGVNDMEPRQNQPGVEFVVRGVIRGAYPHDKYNPKKSVEGLFSNFYVEGDPNGWGIWEKFVEKVVR
jgi:hypothetical protein